MATKESVHRELLRRADDWRTRAEQMKLQGYSSAFQEWTCKAEAYEKAAKLVSEIDSFEQETPNDL